MVVYSSPSLKGHSREDTPPEKTKIFGSNTVNACNAPSHQRIPPLIRTFCGFSQKKFTEKFSTFWQKGVYLYWRGTTVYQLKAQ